MGCEYRLLRCSFHCSVRRTSTVF